MVAAQPGSDVVVIFALPRSRCHIWFRLNVEDESGLGQELQDGLC